MSIKSTQTLTRKEAEKLYYEKVREADFMRIKLETDKELEDLLEMIDEDFLENPFTNYVIRR